MSEQAKMNKSHDDEERDRKGRFRNSGNLAGRPRKRKRALSAAQDREDFLAATEEEIAVVVNGKKTKLPANVFVYKMLVKKAAEQDIRCILAAVERRREIMQEDSKEEDKLADMLARALRAYRERPQAFTDRDLVIMEEIEMFLNDRTAQKEKDDL